MCGVSAEIVKNIMLTGVSSLAIVDNRRIDAKYPNFFINLEEEEVHDSVSVRQC